MVFTIAFSVGPGMHQAISAATVSHCSNTASPLFNITITAGFYSTLAGVLAGFAFTALVFLATARLTAPDRADAFADAIRILVAAFLSLILTSVSYAILAGDPGTDGRTASEEPILGVGFAISGALVIYAIVLMLEGVDRLVKWPSISSQAAGDSTRNVLAAGVAPLLVLYLYLGVQDYEDFRYGPCHGITQLDVLGWSMIGVQALVSWCAYPLLLRRGVRVRSRSTQISYAAWTGRTMLVMTLASAASFALIDSHLVASKTLPPAVPIACMLVIFSAMLGMTWLLAYTRSAAGSKSSSP